MIGNIANSLLQLYFHKHGTPKELQEYYGWDEAFAEEERAGLVDDTLRRIKSEQLILKFYQKEKLKIIKKYGNKNPIGNFGKPVQRTTEHSSVEGNSNGGTEEIGSGESSRNQDGSQPRSEEDNSEGHAQERGGEAGTRHDVAEGSRREGEGGNSESASWRRAGKRCIGLRPNG